MKKLLLVLALLVVPIGCSSSSPKPAKTYSCSMGCTKSDKPGPCPKCQMEMSEVTPETPKKQGGC